MRTIILWLLCPLALATPLPEAQAREPVTFVLQWQHQAQFAGYYMALAKNIYEQAGLDVQLLRGGADVRVGELLRSGEADFGCLMLSTALNERDKNLPLIHLAQVVNRSNFLLVAWREPQEGVSIRKLSDLNNRKVSVWEEDFRAPYLALFASKGIKPIILPQYASFSLFLHRGAVAFSAMHYNEYHALLQSGVPADAVQIFPLRDHGIRMPEDGIYCLAETWRARRETCQAFVRASLAGWQYARDHVEETLDVVMEYVEKDQLPTNRMHMSWMLKEMIASIFPGEDSPWIEGRLSRESYDETLRILSQHAALQRGPVYDSFTVGDEAFETP